MKVKAKAKVRIGKFEPAFENDDLKAQYRDYCKRIRAEGGDPKSFGLWKEGTAEPEDGQGLQGVAPVEGIEFKPETVAVVEDGWVAFSDTTKRNFLLRLAVEKFPDIAEDFVLRHCKAGWYIMVMVWADGSSEAVEKTSSWQTVSGIYDDPYMAFNEAWKSPVVAQLASLKGEPLPLEAGQVIGKSAEPTIDELIDMLHDRIAPDSDSEEFRIAVNSMQTVPLTEETTSVPGEKITRTLSKPVDHTGRETDRKLSEDEIVAAQRRIRENELQSELELAAHRKDWDECKRIEQALVDEGFTEPKPNANGTKTGRMSAEKENTAQTAKPKSAKVERGDKKPELKREETEEAINERLNQLVGKRVRAKRKFHSGGNKASDVVEGTYIGNAYPTTSGTFHGVKKDNGTTTAVLPETITFLEDTETHPDTAKA